MNARRAWVAGATGVVGGYCLDALLADRAYGTVHTFARRSLSRIDQKLVRAHDRLRSARGDAGAAPWTMPIAASATMEAGRSAKLSSGSTTSHVCAFAQLALRAERHAVPARLRGRRGCTLVGVLQPRQGSHRGCRAGASVRRCTCFGRRCSWVAPDASCRRIVVQDAGATAPTALIGPLAKYRPVHARDVALRAIAVAKQNQSGRHIHFFTE
jgi:hypothetical protein